MATVYVPRGHNDLGTLGIVDHDTLQFMDGEPNITAGYDLSALTDGLAALIFGKMATPIIEATNPLKVDVDYGASPLVHFASMGGRVALHPGGGSGVFSRVKHTGAGVLTILGGGTVTRLEQSAGRHLLMGNVTLTTGIMSGGSFTGRYKSSAITTWTQSSGTAAIMRAFTTINMYGGVLDVFPENSGTNVPTATTINMFGGTLNWRGGDITNLNVYGSDAIVNFAEIAQDITVTNLIADMLAKRNARSKFNGTRFTVTYTNKTVYGDENDAFPS